MKYTIDYEVVIPAYNCSKDLAGLIEDIQETCKDYLPKRIIIVDDCSSDENSTFYVGSIYNTQQFPIKVLQTDNHMGPFYAESLGLDNVTSNYALVLHSDTKLRVGSVHPKLEQIKLYSDVLSVLMCYIYQTSNAAAVSCFSVDNNTGKISMGPRGVDINRIPFCNYKQFYFHSLKSMDKFFRWRRVLSLDSNIYALNMKCYKELRFDEEFAPYFLYHDDFFTRCRQSGYGLYVTQDVIAFHPMHNDSKPYGSLSFLDQELFNKHVKIFRDRYNNDVLWSENSIRESVLSKSEIGQPQ